MTNSDRTDQELAQQIRDGDRAAFKELFRRYAGALCAFAEQYTNSSAIAEELVQDLFLKIWKDRRQWSPTDSVKSYLYTSARNLALDYLKHEHVVETWRENTSQDGRSTRPSPDDRLQRKQLRQAVQKAVDELPERCREVFKLSRQHDLTYKEIASVLDISVKTVETHMRRAFRSLRDQLAEREPPDSRPT